MTQFRLSLFFQCSFSSALSERLILSLVGNLCVLFSLASVSEAQLPLAPQVESVLNAASSLPGNSDSGEISPGAIISIIGTDLTDGRTLSATGRRLPRRLGGATVLINGIASPLFFVSPTQINAQVPMEMAGENLVPVQVQVETENGTSTSTARSSYVGAVTPGIFTLSQDGRGYGVMFRKSQSNSNPLCPMGRTDCSVNLAGPGEVLTIHATGLGLVNGSMVSGEAATGALSTIYLPTVTIGGVPATVLYSGLAIGFVGRYQIDVVVPDQLPTHANVEVEVLFRIPGSAGQTLTVRANPVTLPTLYQATEALQSPDRRQRLSGIRALRSVVPEGPRPLQRLAAQNDRVRTALIRTLELENAYVEPPGSHTERDFEYYPYLISMVASFHDPRALNALLGAIGTGGMATDGIAAIGPPAVDALLERLHDPNSPFRSSAVMTLGKLLTEAHLMELDPNAQSRVRQALMEAVEYPDQSLVLSALGALWALRNDPEVRNIFEKFAASISPTSEENRWREFQRKQATSALADSPVFYVNREITSRTCRVQPSTEATTGETYLGPFSSRSTAQSKMCSHFDRTSSYPATCWIVIPPDACEWR